MKEDKATVFVKKCLHLFRIHLSPKTEKLFIQIFKFTIVGGTAFLIDFVLLYLFKEWFHLPVLLANTLSFTVSVIYNYIASVQWVFEVDHEKSAKKQFIVFIFLSVIGLLLNDLIVWLSVEELRIYYLLAKIIATVIVMIFNFITRKIFLEKKEN